MDYQENVSRKNQWVKVIRWIIHLQITLIQYGTMVFNLWFKEHNICFNSYIV